MSHLPFLSTSDHAGKVNVRFAARAFASKGNKGLWCYLSQPPDKNFSVPLKAGENVPATDGGDNP